jgi:phosphatidylinositol alpha 1,6-mannosyltransferase
VQHGCKAHISRKISIILRVHTVKMNKLRIVLVTGNYNHIPDGVSLTLNRLVKYLESKGNEVLIVAPSIKNPPIKHAGRLVEVPSYAMPGREEYRIGLGLTSRIKEEIARFNPDLVHIATPDFTGFQALMMAADRNYAVVSSYHTHFSSYLEYYKLSFLEHGLWAYLRFFYSNCIHTYVPSESMIAGLGKQGITDGLQIWARGIETEVFNPQRRDLHWRRENGINDDDVVVSFVSRLVWEKEMRTLRAVFNELHKRNPKIKTIIVGEGPAGHELKATMPNTLFAGYQKGENLARIYASSDVFMFPSITETFGNVTLEAQASGVPVVVANAQGNASLVDHGFNGFLVTPKDASEFTERILLLATKHDLRNRMSKNAVQFASKFTWDNIFGQLVKNYNEAIEIHKAAKG